MLRALFVLAITAVGLYGSIQSTFYGLLFYLWLAYFRPEQWIWNDFYSSLNLSFYVGVYVLVGSFFSKTKFRFDFRAALMFGFLVHSLFSTLVSSYQASCIPFWVEFAKAVMIGYLISVCASTLERYRLVVLTIVLSIGFEAAKQGWAALVLHPGQKNMNELPLFGDNNGVAVGMIMLAPVILALARAATRRWERNILLFVMVGVLFRGISTYSRGAFLSCGVLAVIHLFRTKNKARDLIATVVLGTLLLSVLPDAFWNRMATIRTADQEEEPGKPTEGRIHFWRVAVNMANDHPLTGVGHNAYRMAYNQYDFLNGEFGYDRSVHSAWFGVLAELGYVGLLLYGAMFYSTFQSLRSVVRRAARDPRLAHLGLYASGLEAAFAVFVVGATFVPSQYIEMLWHFFGLSMALQAIAAAAEPAGAASRGTPAPASSASPIVSRSDHVAAARRPDEPAGSTDRI